MICKGLPHHHTAKSKINSMKKIQKISVKQEINTNLF